MTSTTDHSALVSQASLLAARRVARAASVGLLCLAAILVGYGALPTAKVTTDVQNRLFVSHDRFGTLGNPQSVVVRVARQRGEAVTIKLDAASAEAYAFNRTEPPADTITKGPGGIDLMFGSGRNSEVFEVAMTFTPMKWGRHQLTLSALVGQRLTVQAAIDHIVAPL